MCSEAEQVPAAVCARHGLPSGVERAHGVCGQQRGGSRGVAGQGRHPPRRVRQRARQDCGSVVVGGSGCVRGRPSAMPHLQPSAAVGCRCGRRPSARAHALAALACQGGGAGGGDAAVPGGQPAHAGGGGDECADIQRAGQNFVRSGAGRGSQLALCHPQPSPAPPGLEGSLLGGLHALPGLALLFRCSPTAAAVRGACPSARR